MNSKCLQDWDLVSHKRVHSNFLMPSHQNKTVHLKENDKETGSIIFYFLHSPLKIRLFFEIRGSIQIISWDSFINPFFVCLMIILIFLLFNSHSVKYCKIHSIQQTLVVYYLVNSECWFSEPIYLKTGP